MRTLVVPFLIALATPAVGPAQSAAPAAAADELLNTPSVNDWNVYGPAQTHRLHREAKVQGGGAMRIEVAGRTSNVWDIGASVPVSGAIGRGDKLLVALWARAAAPVDVPAILQVASPPYAPIVAGTVHIGTEWKLVSITGRAAEDHPAGTANVALQLGGAAGQVELGPLFVLRQPR